MLHPRLTPLGATIGGSSSRWLSQVGIYGSWSDLQVNTRWGEGACGMFEVQWTMPLPPGFEHPLLRRGTIVEIMDGPWRIGSPLILSEPARSASLDQPWQFVATGVAREVLGDNSYYTLDAVGDVTNDTDAAVDQAIVRGLPWGGRASSFLSGVAFGAEGELRPIGVLLSSVGDYAAQRWFVGQDNLVGFASDPTEPTYQVIPGAASLGTADDNYASTVLVRFLDSVSGNYLTVSSTDATVAATYGHREFPVDVTGDDYGAMTAASAQTIADGILAKAKGRLAWTNGMTLTSNEILTMGGVPADLSKVLEDVGEGCMVRLHGTWSDLLAYNGQTWLDIVIGEARYTDGAQTIDLAPMGLAARDLSRVVEEITGIAA